jgi:hypothetical protein
MQVVTTPSGTDVKTFDTFSTRLWERDVAGPGMLLHFRFQVFFIIWPFCVAVVWTVLAIFHNELFILGTRKFGTPRHNCILVAWGYETQQRLMWTKVLFLAIVYVGSFISFLWFSVSQKRKYHQMDAVEKTMKDFACELKGLPELSGSDVNVEKDIQTAVEAALGSSGLDKKSVVGISVAWDYRTEDGELQERVDNACQRDLTWRQIEWELEQKNVKHDPAQVQKALDDIKAKANEDPSENYGALRKKLYSLEKSVLGPNEDEDDKEAVTAMLKDLKSSDTAFVVFTTEEAKNEALEKVANVKFKPAGSETEATLTLEEVSNEPANLNWQNFGENNVVLGFLKGFFKVYVPALLIWFLWILRSLCMVTLQFQLRQRG